MSKVIETVIENDKLTYQITTEAGEGGTISGSDQNPYETVRHGENSVKDIVITPNPNYEIKTIYVNDEPIEIPEAGENGVVTLDKFTNVTENKHIEVTYALTSNKFTISKMLLNYLMILFQFN